MRLGTLGLALALGASACVGQIVDPGDKDGVGPGSPGSSTTQKLVCKSTKPDTEPGVIRMLNRREYRNTVEHLLGFTVAAIDTFPADPIVGFDNFADSLVASSTLVDKQLEAAEALAAQADVGALAPCDSGNESECADTFIASFGRRAYRRPLAAEETTVLRELYDGARSAGRTYHQAVRLIIEAALQSPQFLYRAETNADGVVAVDGFELASRLSYFLWASMPDDALLDAAESGALADKATREDEVRRLLADPKARATTTAFHELWLQLNDLESLTKKSDVYADFATLAPDLKEETATFADWVFWDGAGDAARLLTSNVGFLNDALAQHYGLPAPGSADFQQVDLTGSNRFGLLTQGGFLAHFANPDRTSPTKRGKFVRQQLLCQPPPPPPEGVPPLPSASTSGLPIREMLAQHVADPVCAGCHSRMDPIGFGLERYDTVGRYRDLDNGSPIDDSGELIEVTGGEGKFVGARELAEHLVQTEEYYDCVATQWFRFAIGRREGQRDACSLEKVQKAFRESGHSLPELVVAVALSDAFTLKNTVE